MGRVAWLLGAYPIATVGALYATWGVAWLELGHRPVPSIDDPASISAVVDVPRWVFMILLIGMFPMLAVYLGVAVAAVVERRRGGRRTGMRGPLFALAALAVWAGAFVLLRWDPWEVGVWYMD